MRVEVDKTPSKKRKSNESSTTPSKSKKTKSSSKSSSKKANKTKRVPTGYVLFCTATRPKVVSENPGAALTDYMKILGAQWNELSEAEKKVITLLTFEIN